MCFLKKNHQTKPSAEVRKTNLSRQIMIYCSILYGCTWIVMVVSWFMYRELPIEIKEYTTYVYSIAIAVYFGKTAYENGKKQLASDTLHELLMKENKKNTQPGLFTCRRENCMFHNKRNEPHEPNQEDV